MNVWAIADLHLSFGVPEKTMEAFGEVWKNYASRLSENWNALIHKDDLVLIAGDISWALKFHDALIDLKWIAELPGTKILLKGNHDYWWGSLKKMQSLLPPTLHLLQNNSFSFHGITIGGARLWDTSEYSFKEFVEYVKNPKENEKEQKIQEDLSEGIFQRELIRLKISLQTLDPKAHTRIAMTHYPPIGADLKDSMASAILEEHKIRYTVFGHLHNLKRDKPLFGEKNGIKYILTAADYLNFTPIRIL